MTDPETNAHLSPRVQPSTPWIVGPTFDLLLICGGVPLLLVLFHLALLHSGAPPGEALTPNRAFVAALLIGQHLFANAHNAATYLRLYKIERDRPELSFYRRGLVGICLALFVCGVLYPPFISTAVYLYFLAVFWHYAAQSYGVGLIYCYKRGCLLRPVERRLIRTTMLLFALYVPVRFLTFQELSPARWIGIDMPFWGPFPLWIFRGMQLLTGATALLAGVAVLRRLVLREPAVPLPSLMILLTTFLLGRVEGPSTGLIWLYAPAFFHGTQYLAVTFSYCLRSESENTGLPICSFWSYRVGEYLFSAVVTGAFLYVFVPHFFQQLGFDFAAVGGLVLATVNLHHFITDARIWKLRDPRARQLLIR